MLPAQALVMAVPQAQATVLAPSSATGRKPAGRNALRNSGGLLVARCCKWATLNQCAIPFVAKTCLNACNGQCDDADWRAKLANVSTDGECRKGPYVLDLVNHIQEGIGSSFLRRKMSLLYASALDATYVDTDSALAPGSVIPKGQSTVIQKNGDIQNNHDLLDYSEFFGLGSKTCPPETLFDMFATGGGHLKFVAAKHNQIEPEGSGRDHGEILNRIGENATSRALCAALERGQAAPFDSDPLLKQAKSAVGGDLSKLVLVFDEAFNKRNTDFNFCAFSPMFRRRFRRKNNLEKRPRAKPVPGSQMTIAVHFRWGDVATKNVDRPNSDHGVPLSDLVAATEGARQRIGAIERVAHKHVQGSRGKVLFFSEGKPEDFKEFTDAVTNVELRLGDNSDTAQDLIDMAQADVLIGGTSTFFVLAAHLSDGAVVISSAVAGGSFDTEAPPEESKWGQHIQLVSMRREESTGLTFNGTWWEQPGVAFRR